MFRLKVDHEDQIIRMERDHEEKVLFLLRQLSGQAILPFWKWFQALFLNKCFIQKVGKWEGYNSIPAYFILKNLLKLLRQSTYEDTIENLIGRIIFLPRSAMFAEYPLFAPLLYYLLIQEITSDNIIFQYDTIGSEICINPLPQALSKTNIRSFDDPGFIRSTATL